MFSVLARGVGSWTGEVALDAGAVYTRDCRSAIVDVTRETDVSPLPLNFHNGVHRHGVTVSSHSIASSSFPSAAATPGPSDHGELILPRTFTTRKGALMLFADDTQVDYSQCRHLLSSTKRTQTRLFQDELENLGSLTRLSSSVLMFGDQDYDTETCSISNPENKVFLKFLKSLGGVEVDLNVQPGGDANDYLRNLRHRLIRTKLKSGDRRSLLNGSGQGRLVQSMSSIPQLKSADHLTRGGPQMHFPDRLITAFPKEPDSQKVDLATEFSVVGQPSETVIPPRCYSAASLPGIYDEAFRSANPLHGFFDKFESQTLPISSVLLTSLSRNASRPQSRNGSNSAKKTADEQAMTQSTDLTGDEDCDDLSLAYGMLRDYDSQGYYEVDERTSSEANSSLQGDGGDEMDLVQPLMPAYDPAYDGLPSINKSFPIEITRIHPLLPSPPAKSVGAKPRSATPRASARASSTAGLFPPKNRPATARISRPNSTPATTARVVKSAGHSEQRSPPIIVSRSRTRSKEITADQLTGQPPQTMERNSQEQAVETNACKSDKDERLSKTLRITRMKTPSGREKKQNALNFTRELEEKATCHTTADAEETTIRPTKEDSAEVTKVEVIETKFVETRTSDEEVKTAPISSRRKSKKTKGAIMLGEDNGSPKKLDADKVALREARRKEADLKKLLKGERVAEEKRLAEERKLAEEARLAEQEKLAEKLERDREDFIALAEQEARLQVEIAEARRKAEEAREIEDDARNALAATWKLAREHREEQRKANIERRKQELIDRNRKEQECISNAKRKEQEMLERIGSADELRRFREAERLRKEEVAHAQMLRLEDEEHLASISYEKEEERYLDMEREAEEAAMEKLVQERLEAEQRPEMLKEKQRRLRSEGSKKKSALLAEEQEREERLRKLQEEQERMDEEARQRLLQMQKLQEETVEQAQQVRDARCSAALKRRELNIKNRRHLELLRHDQTNLNQPWTFSYYVHWPRETYAKVTDQDPRKKSGFRTPIKHSGRK